MKLKWPNLLSRNVDTKQQQDLEQQAGRNIAGDMDERALSVMDDITMERAISVASNAEQGNIQDLIDLYMKAERLDTRNSGMIGTRRRKPASMQSTVQMPKQDSAGYSEQLQNAIKFMDDQFEKLRFNNIKKQLMDGVFHGVKLMENIWEKDKDGMLVLKDIARIDHRRYRMDMDSMSGRGRYGQLYLADLDSTGYEDRKLYLDKIPEIKLVSANAVEHEAYYDMYAVLRPLIRWFVIKTWATKNWLQFSNKYGHPIPIVTVTEQDWNQNKQDIVNLLESVGANRYAVFFENMNYELHNPSQAQNIEVFKSLIELANTESAISVLGQNLTSEVEGGSYAASQTHYQILDDIVKDDTDWLDEIITDQIIAPAVALNFPDLPPYLYPVYKTKQSKNVDLNKLGTGLKTMSKIIQIPTDWIYEVSDIPKPTEEDETIGGFNNSLQPEDLDTN